MKTTLPRGPRARIRHTQGWTLIELLFVMLIIVLLAGLVAAAAGPVKNRIARYRTQNRLEALQTGLTAWKTDNGSFPICEKLEDGGPLLYKCLFGDFNGNAMPDSSPNDENDSQVKTYMPKLLPPKFDKNGTPIGTTLVMPLGDSYAAVDVWNSPFFYMNFKPNTNADVPDGGGQYSRGSYDLWSLGNDPNRGDENRAMWIKNW
ncbi:MAG: type II secretory pathway pseudopilin PulG [Verrucomicrobiales bacterium]|jgi:type II secretory pathway pseudopilin PulG